MVNGKAKYLNKIHDHVEFLSILESVVQAHDKRVSHICKNSSLCLCSFDLRERNGLRGNEETEIGITWRRLRSSDFLRIFMA